MLSRTIIRCGLAVVFQHPARSAIPITVLVVIQAAFFISVYWVRQRYKRNSDLRGGIILAGIYGLLIGLAGMYYAGQLGLVSVTTFSENYFGFSVYMLSRQLFQDLRECFFRISLQRTSRFRPLHGWFTPLRGLAILLQGSISFSCDRTLSALITASLTPSVMGPTFSSHLVSTTSRLRKSGKQCFDRWRRLE
jgi:hypothetical protein